MNEETPSAKFCRITVEETARQLHTSPTAGLESARDANHRRSVYGENTLEAEEEESMLVNFLGQFTSDPLVLMLIASSVISLVLGNKEDAFSIAVAIFVVVSVGFIQEYRSEQSLKALNTLVPPSAHLVREGIQNNILASNLVPGDVVHFSVGDRIPADVRIVSAVHLSIDESSLTGETHPVDKTEETISGLISPPLAQRVCIAHMGTLVTTGHGTGIVVGTGPQTEFGAIFSMMTEIDKPKTPLQISMDKLGKELSLMSFGVIGIICLIGLFQGRKLLDMFQIGVSLAVAAIPEGLPIIVTVTLALGVLRMAKANAIIRHLPSVETLGSVNVICTDKTGTLTLNKLTATKIFAGAELSQIPQQAHPTRPQSVVLRLGSICNNSKLITAAGTSKYVGNPVDVALQNILPHYGLSDFRPTVSRVAETPFSSSRKWMAVSAQSTTGETILCVKGAIEILLPHCVHAVDGTGQAVPLTEQMRASISEAADHEADLGMRIMALAYRADSQDVTNLEQLVFAGFVAMYDPPRPGVKRSMRRLLQCGVKIIMITGDNEHTAASAAREVGIPVPSSGPALDNCIMTGPVLEKLSPEELSSAIQNVLVFARTTPEMKLKIVRSLQMCGDIVAMTGDGVNDAPALKLADIGVSMGSGTDVAKEASDMILVNDDFSTILEAIKDGKGIFTNIKAFLTFQLSTSVAALSLIVFSTLFKFPNPLNPMQILWINILMDGPPAQSLGVEPVDPAVMHQPPRSRNDHVLTPAVGYRVALRGAMILIGTMFVYVREMGNDGVTARDTTMSFTCFVLFDLFNALTSRSATRSVLDIGFFSNKMFNYAVGMSLLGQLAVIYVPPFQRVFQTEALSFGDLLFLTMLTSSLWIVDEFIKRWLRRKALEQPSLQAELV